MILYQVPTFGVCLGLPLASILSGQFTRIPFPLMLLLVISIHWPLTLIIVCKAPDAFATFEVEFIFMLKSLYPIAVVHIKPVLLFFTSVQGKYSFICFNGYWHGSFPTLSLSTEYQWECAWSLLSPQERRDFVRIICLVKALLGVPHSPQNKQNDSFSALSFHCVQRPRKENS